MNCSIAAFDLDGTLLDSNKKISQANMEALKVLAAEGVEIVPATGRIVSGLKLVLDELPFVRWCITVNGAAVWDLMREKIIHRAEIPVDTALKVCEYMDGIDAIYDCYQDEWGYMTDSMYRRAEEFYPAEPGILYLIKKFRTPVDSLPEYIREKGKPLQKLQLHFTDMEERQRQLKLLPELFPELAVSSSLPNNIEINHRTSTKGRALNGLCDYLGLDIADTVAFGDGSNDLDMLIAAGTGVAMANGMDAVKAAADFVTVSNNESGVAYAIEKLKLHCRGAVAD